MFMLAGLAAAALFAFARPDAPNEPDRMSLRDRVRQERIDEDWARGAEVALESIYAPVRGVGPVTVLCAATLCEVTGEVAPGEAGRAAELLQGPALDHEAKAAGFREMLAFRISTYPETEGRTSFASYWARGTTTSAPRVARTSPADGMVIPTGRFTLAVTFDQPMMADRWSFVRFDPATYPDCDPTPEVSADGRTFRLKCRAEKGKHYRIGFNRPPYMNFVGRTGMPAEPAVLSFEAR